MRLENNSEFCSGFSEKAHCISKIFPVQYTEIFLFKKVQVGKDQEKAQSERDSHSKNRGLEKTKLTIRHLYHETYRKPNEQLFSQ